jgi:hypothetical protein
MSKIFGKGWPAGSEELIRTPAFSGPTPTGLFRTAQGRPPYRPFTFSLIRGLLGLHRILGRQPLLPSPRKGIDPGIALVDQCVRRPGAGVLERSAAVENDHLVLGVPGRPGCLFARSHPDRTLNLVRARRPVPAAPIIDDDHLMVAEGGPQLVLTYARSGRTGEGRSEKRNGACQSECEPTGFAPNSLHDLTPRTYPSIPPKKRPTDRRT